MDKYQKVSFIFGDNAYAYHYFRKIDKDTIRNYNSLLIIYNYDEKN